MIKRLCCLFAITIALMANYLAIKEYAILGAILAYTTIRLIIDFILITFSFFYEEKVLIFIEKISKIKKETSWCTRCQGVYKWVFINFIILGVCFEFIYIKALV